MKRSPFKTPNKKLQRASEHYFIKLVSMTDLQPSVGTDFKCSLILSAQRLIGAVAWWFSTFAIADFLHTKLVIFMLFGVR